jgi:hypothetical protein
MAAADLVGSLAEETTTLLTRLVHHDREAREPVTRR